MGLNPNAPVTPNSNPYDIKKTQAQSYTNPNSNPITLDFFGTKALDPGGPGTSQTRAVVKGAGKSWEVRLMIKILHCP